MRWLVFGPPQRRIESKTVISQAARHNTKHDDGMKALTLHRTPDALGVPPQTGRKRWRLLLACCAVLMGACSAPVRFQDSDDAAELYSVLKRAGNQQEQSPQVEHPIEATDREYADSQPEQRYPYDSVA